jgi:putative ABC transport system permease protein
VTLAGLAARNLLRNKFRTIATTFAIAVVVLLFVVLRTVLWCWNLGAELAAKDRIVTRHKVTFVMPLPKRYADDVRVVPNVKSVTYMNWFGARDPKNENDFFATMAVEDSKSFFEVYDEVQVDPQTMERYNADRRAAIVGDQLLKRKNWKVGDKVVLAGTIYPGDHEFTIAGTYTALRKSIDRSSFWFHWGYLNDIAPDKMKDQIGWVAVRVKDESRVAETAAAIDKMFDDRDTQTASQSERAFNLSFMAAFAAILTALDIVSLAILVVMALILGNTIAMGVRERTSEYGTLRAIGFLPRHLVMLVLGEAVTLGLLGGLVGLGLSWPLVNGLGQYLEENMAGFFPYFRMPAETGAMAVVLAVLLGALGGLLPARRAFKLNIVSALRRVG